MSTYAKSWITSLLLTATFAVLLWSFIEPLPLPVTPEVGRAIAFGLVIVVGVLASKFPKCQHCLHPVNEPEYGSGFSIFMFRPSRPRRTCGYCGTNLLHTPQPD